MIEEGKNGSERERVTNMKRRGKKVVERKEEHS